MCFSYLFFLRCPYSTTVLQFVKYLRYTTPLVHVLFHADTNALNFFFNLRKLVVNVSRNITKEEMGEQVYTSFTTRIYNPNSGEVGTFFKKLNKMKIEWNKIEILYRNTLLIPGGKFWQLEDFQIM